MTRRQGAAAALALAMGAAALAGCGKRGRLEPPEGSSFPQRYPAPETMIPSGGDGNDAERTE